MIVQREISASKREEELTARQRADRELIAQTKRTLLAERQVPAISEALCPLSILTLFVACGRPSETARSMPANFARKTRNWALCKRYVEAIIIPVQYA